MTIIFYENSKVEDLSPITLTRASFDILCAGATLFDAAKNAFPKAGFDALVREYVLGLTRVKHPKLSKKYSDEIILLDGALVPSIKQVQQFAKKCEAGKSFILKNEKGIAGAYLNLKELYISKSEISKIHGGAVVEFLAKLKLRVVAIAWPQLEKLWEPITYNKKLISENLSMLADSYEELESGVFIGKNVSIAENVVYDASEGPIIIDDSVKIKPFVYLKGPVYIGKKSIINEFSSIKNGACIGEACKIGGEVDATIIQGYSNKQHHGVLAYAWIGEWVNVGGAATNSDLKNTYGIVKMRNEDTGELFLGCVIGDYSKIGINSSILTGKVIGVNSSVLGIVARDIPSFTNFLGGLGDNVEFSMDMALQVQKKMFDRRRVIQTKAHKDILADVYKMTQKDRREYKVKKGKILFK